MSKKNNRLTNVDITKMLGVPRSTLQDWKNKSNDDYRNKIYNFLKSHTYEELETKLNSVNEK